MNISSNSIVRSLIQEFGLKMNKFRMVDMNTFYYVHGLRSKTYSVMQDPDVLKYNLPKRERHIAPLKLLEMALRKVRKGNTETSTENLKSNPFCLLFPALLDNVFNFHYFCFCRSKKRSRLTAAKLCSRNTTIIQLR